MSTPTSLAGVFAMGLLLGICLLGMVLCGICSYFTIWCLIPTFVFVGVGLLAAYRLLQASR